MDSRPSTPERKANNTGSRVLPARYRQRLNPAAPEVWSEQQLIAGSPVTRLKPHDKPKPAPRASLNEADLEFIARAQMNNATSFVHLGESS